MINHVIDIVIYTYIYIYISSSIIGISYEIVGSPGTGRVFSARPPLWDGLRGICQVGRSVRTRHDAGHGWEVETHHVHKAVPDHDVPKMENHHGKMENHHVPDHLPKFHMMIFHFPWFNKHLG